jgi:dihydrodipicolinate synthase/N-acetylneuraminate lyase
MENKKSQQELIEDAKKLAEQHAELKLIVYNILDDMDIIELKYRKIVEEIKKN